MKPKLPTQEVTLSVYKELETKLILIDQRN